jgi:abortive phage resistance protein AbiGi (putative antitoxin)
MPYDYAIHSDLLVHWTGNDIEKRFRTSGWYKDESSKTSDNGIEDAYLDRLKSILKHGLWMTDQEPPEIGRSDIPRTPCTCFTELKLSQSRTHAKRYGRLGIALKRPFVLSRGGRPVNYYLTHHHDLFVRHCADDLKDKRLLHFFKAMNSGEKGLNYDFYSESEWRIVLGHSQDDAARIVDPRSPGSDAKDYFESLREDQKTNLRYLIPLDGWLALLIYPSLAIKNRAQDPRGEIIGLIRAIKERKDHAHRIEGRNLPAEIDLDMCRNF